MEFVIKSDGTRDGTTFTVDGEEVANLTSAEIWFGEFSNQPFISWSTEEDFDEEVGVVERRHFMLQHEFASKGEAKGKTEKPKVIGWVIETKQN